jgi:hypothetical protein
LKYHPRGRKPTGDQERDEKKKFWRPKAATAVDDEYFNLFRFNWLRNNLRI